MKISIRKNWLLFLSLTITLPIVFFSCGKDDPLKAGFDLSDDEIETGTELITTNNSTGSETFSWDFGDGNVSSLKEPRHTYNTPGNYTIRLTASKEMESVTSEKNIRAFTFPDGEYKVTGLNVKVAVSIPGGALIPTSTGAGFLILNGPTPSTGVVSGNFKITKFSLVEMIFVLGTNGGVSLSFPLEDDINTYDQLKISEKEYTLSNMNFELILEKQ